MKTGNYIVHFFKRIQRKSGRSTAITGTANKLSKIIWNMLMKKQAYKPMLPVEHLNKMRIKELKHIQRKIRQLNIKEDEITFAVA